MSNNKNLFKEAIADAKAVRDAALLNAKNALEEALTPSIQNMLATKLNEMDEEEMSFSTEEAEMEENFDLASILAELEDENTPELREGEEDSDLEETKKKDDKKDEKDAKKDKKEDEAENEDEAEDEVEVKDLSIEDLKDIIRDVVAAEMETGEEEIPMETGEEEIPMDMPDMGAEEEMISSEDEEINLEELLAELDSLDNNDLEETKKNTKKEKDELKEAISVINTLRTQLKETNLLNAKLLYVNKIFKVKNLSESQKINVIASFDKANTPKEAKMIFESLNATLTANNKKTPIRESLGFASKATGVAPKKQIVESNDAITRMQKLANIIK